MTVVATPKTDVERLAWALYSAEWGEPEDDEYFADWADSKIEWYYSPRELAEMVAKRLADIEVRYPREPA